MRNQNLLQSLPLLASVVIAAPTGSDHATQIFPIKEGQKAPATVLKPAIHWDVSPDNAANVRPSSKLRLYYAMKGAADPTKEHHFGSTSNNYTLPAVNIDASDHVDIDKASGQIKISFHGEEAWENAYDSWGSLKKLLLLTYAPICGNHDAGDYCYVVVTNTVFNNDTNTVTAKAKSVKAEDVLHSTSFEWGVYKPTSKKIAARADSAANATGCGNRDAHGLQTVHTGEGFDHRLDECLGFESIDSTSWKAYAKGVGADQEAKSTLTPDHSKNLHGSGEFLHGDNAEKIAKAMASNGMRTVSSRLAKRGWFDWVPIDIPAINTPISKDFSKGLTWSLPENKGNDKSPWGTAKLLKKWTGQKTSTGVNGRGSGSVAADGSISIWCVNCGADGSIQIYGKGAWSANNGLTEGYVTATTNLNIVLQLGIEVQGTLNAQGDQQLGSYGVPGLSFGVITIGPYISLGSEFVFMANAEGKMLAGGRFGFQDAKATLDFVNSAKSASSGWTPRFEPIFEANGQIAVGAEVAVPVAISIGVDILNGKYVKSVGLVERPAVEAKAEFSAEVSGKNAKITTTDGCQGIATQVTFKNDLFADIVGKKFNLMSPYTKTLTKGCVKIPGVGKFAATVPASFSASSPNFSGFNTTSGTEYTELVDATHAFFLATCPDSNMYLRPKTDESSINEHHCTRIFESSHDSVVGDGNSRIMHYYGETMSKLGVSRLRLHSDAALPKGSEFVSFYAFSNSTGHLVADADVNDDKAGVKAYYVAKNAHGEEFFPALCTYVDHAKFMPKVFLVKDAEKGVAALHDKALEGSITGAEIAKCYLLPVQQPPAEKGESWNNDWTVNQGNEGAKEGAKLDKIRNFFTAEGETEEKA